MKLLKKIALFTLIFTMCISTVTYACPNTDSYTIIDPTALDEMEDGRIEIF